MTFSHNNAFVTKQHDNKTVPFNYPIHLRTIHIQLSLRPTSNPQNVCFFNPVIVNLCMTHFSKHTYVMPKINKVFVSTILWGIRSFYLYLLVFFLYLFSEWSTQLKCKKIISLFVIISPLHFFLTTINVLLYSMEFK